MVIMDGKYIVGDRSYLKIEDISKTDMVCTFHSAFNYRVIGEHDTPTAIDPSGGYMMYVGKFKIEEWKLQEISWDQENKVYVFKFTRQN